MTTLSELEVDTSPLTLSGFNISIAGSGLPWASTGAAPANATGKREVRGGLPPYTFSSSHPHFASVDSNGTVRSEGNGTSTIIVQDAAGQSKKFVVTTSNVVRYLDTPQRLTHSQYLSWVNNIGGKIVKESEWEAHLIVLNIKYLALDIPTEAWWWGPTRSSQVNQGYSLRNFESYKNWLGEGRIPKRCLCWFNT